MFETLVLLGLSFFSACGFCLTAAACITGGSVFPLMSVLLGFMSLITVCSCDLFRMRDGDMPSALADSGDHVAATRSDVGWMMCGIFITAAWSLPLVLARHRVMSMRVSWLASTGTWSLVASLGLFTVFLSKGQQQQHAAWDN